VKAWLKNFATDKLPLALVNALILGLIAKAITDRWQDERKQAELKLGLLKEFEDRSNKLIGCMMAPRAMVQDRECLVVELNLLGMASAFKVVYDQPFHEDFDSLAQIIATAHGHTTEGNKWVLPDAAFEKFRKEYTDRVRHMRQRMLTELGGF